MVEMKSPASIGGQGKYMRASFGFRLRQHCQFLTLAIFLLKHFF